MEKINFLKEKIKSLPLKPGVYLMKDKNNNIIYIGKAKILPNRLRSYFQKINSLDQKTIKMIEKIDNIDFITTETEIEALILEANLIKKYKPKYNINLKDDKKYPFIKITYEDFPKIVITRNIDKSSGKYYGPYTDVKEFRKIMKLIRMLFQFRDCNLHLTYPLQKRYKPCLNFQIKRCPGPCTGNITPENYNVNIAMIKKFLNGKTKELENMITEFMNKSAAELNFEKAAMYRDLLFKIKKLLMKQAIHKEQNIDKDFIGYVVTDDFGCIVLFQIREGRLIGKKHFFINNVSNINLDDILLEFIQQFYIDQDFIPDKIVVDKKILDKKLLSDWLSNKNNKKVEIIENPVGDDKKILKLVLDNASYYLDEYIRQKSNVIGKISLKVKALQNNLNLPLAPIRIEAFDISHQSGSNTVASCITFINGKPEKNKYRIYKINNSNNIDDFKAIYEVVYRRYKRLLKENAPLPDLILIDGGKGQVNSAINALKKLQIDNIPILGLAKKFEEIYMPNKKDAIIIPKTSLALRLLQAIRDESHRFAVKNHRSLKRKNFIESILDNVPGIGEKRKMLIINEFGSIKNLLSAEKDEIKKRTKLPDKVVENLYSLLHTPANEIIFSINGDIK